MIPSFTSTFFLTFLITGSSNFSMSDSPQNILREAADGLIQTAKHLGRVASLSSKNSAASTNAISNSSTNGAQLITSSAASEHARLLGYRPPAAGNVRSPGTSARGSARGRSNCLVQYHLHQQGLTWSRLFVCLAYSNQRHLPTPSECVVLALNKLGEKHIEFSRNGNRTQVHESIISTFPCLASSYHLPNSEGRRKELLKIPMPASGFFAIILGVLGQAKGFLCPLQKDIVLVGESASSSSNSERCEVRNLTN